MTPQRFQELAEGGFLLEHAEYVGNRYGTPRGYVESRLLEGRSVVLDIEVQGAAQVQRNCPDAVTVFILPPSGEELERRLPPPEHRFGREDTRAAAPGQARVQPKPGNTATS